MIEFIKSIWDVLVSSIINFIVIIQKIPLYFNYFWGCFTALNITPADYLTLIIGSILTIGILIKIKRLII